MQHSTTGNTLPCTLYCSANVTKQVTHTTWENIMHEINSVAFGTKKCGLQEEILRRKEGEERNSKREEIQEK